MALLIVVAAEPLIRVFASAKYLKSIGIILPLVFAVVIDSLSWISGIGISLSKKTIFKTISYVITLLTSLAAIWLLIKPFGLMGVVYGILISKVVLAFTKTLFAYKLYHLRFNFKWVIPIVACGFICALIIRSIDFLQWYIQIPIGFGIFMIFVSIMWKYVVMDEDKKRVLEILRAKLKGKKG
jgi:O-antigen/teichoic acid export membrane protein